MMMNKMVAAPALAGMTAFLPNNFPQPNPAGLSATFSTRGVVDLTGDYFRPQGTNGRSCSTCHTPQDAWRINPATIAPSRERERAEMAEREGFEPSRGESRALA